MPLSSSLILIISGSKKREREGGEKEAWKIKDERKEVKRRRGQQLASAGLELTLSFYKGSKETKIEELKECSGLLGPPCPLPLTPPLISPPAKQGSKGGREGVLVIKLQTFPHLMVLCHVSAFLHSSLAVLVFVSPNSDATHFTLTNRKKELSVC